MESELLEGRLEDDAALDLDDRSYVWKAWFRMTPRGKDLWSAAEYAPVLEPAQPQ